VLSKKMQIKYKSKIQKTKRIVKEGLKINQSKDSIILKIGMHLNMMPISAEAFYKQAVNELEMESK
tara:strand:- start:242 stop:439 length:198 start_codon:yes stop_codon:yes gene_type:complete